MGQLGKELTIGFLLVAVAVCFHVLGLLGLMRFTRLHLDHLRTPWLALDRLLVPLGMATGLFAVAAAEVGGFAAAYRGLGAVTTWEQGLYVSAASYSTAGWTGVQVPDGWRVLTALEALGGLLLTGWSTAFLFQNLHRILSTETSHPLPAGAIAPEPEEDSEETEKVG